jgi:hypothetical protein
MEPGVLNLVSGYLRRDDMCGAWEYLNCFYLTHLKSQVSAYQTALEDYCIRRDQTFARYVWVVEEIVFDACEAINGVEWPDEDRLRIIEKGIHDDHIASSLYVRPSSGGIPNRHMRSSSTRSSRLKWIKTWN